MVMAVCPGLSEDKDGWWGGYQGCRGGRRCEDCGVEPCPLSGGFRSEGPVHQPQGWPEKEGEHHFGSLLVEERSACLLAEFDGEVVGYLAGYAGAGAHIRPVAVAELESMYVMEGYRGRGLGTRMVEGFLDWAGTRGAERVSVTAYAANNRALRFYERNGFGPKSLTLERSVG
jgi:GNAT superfamily N-acetyltransferase